MYKPDLKNAVKFKDDYKMIPVCREIFSDFITPIKALKKLMNESRHCYMLESAENQEKWGRYTFLLPVAFSMGAIIRSSPKRY